MIDIYRFLYKNKIVFKRSATDIKSFYAFYFLNNNIESFFEYIQFNKKNNVLSDIETLFVYFKRFKFNKIIKSSLVYWKVSAVKNNKKKSVF